MLSERRFGLRLLCVVIFLPCTCLLLFFSNNSSIYGLKNRFSSSLSGEWDSMNKHSTKTKFDKNNPERSIVAIINRSSYEISNKSNINVKDRNSTILLATYLASTDQLSINNISKDVSKNFSSTPYSTATETPKIENENRTRPIFRFGKLGTASNPLTIILQMSGEMGNHLSKIIYGYGIQWILEEDYNITTNILIRHQSNGKWLGAVKHIKQCFIKSRDWSFETANTDEYDRREKLQNLKYKSKNKEDQKPFEINPDCQTERCIRQKLDFIARFLQHNPTNSSTVDKTANENITLPFLYLNAFANIGYINDRYHSKIKEELLKFDYNNPNCCNQTAYPDESALHIRGFLWEMPRKGKKRGYEELSPHKVATELFGHLPRGSKVGIVARLPMVARNYTKVLRDIRGIEARYIQDQSPTQDFCFLLSAQRELAGFERSTFAVMAAYLGNATIANLYSLKSPERVSNVVDNSYFVRYNWTNPILKKRITFALYNSEEQDQIENNSSVKF